MTVLQLQEKLREVLETASTRLYGAVPDHIASEVPPKTELGDLAFPAAFELAKLLKARTGEKQNPRAIAEALKPILEEQEGVERVEVAGPGYLNVFFDRARMIADASGGEAAAAAETSPAKVCVEHTSVNPNKAAHIGHVRNSVLGDSFQRILSATGRRVEIQNYIDNTGVQVADVVVGFLFVLAMDLAAIKELDARLSVEGTRFDHYCWDLYARVGQEYMHDENLKERRNQVLHAIEGGTGPIAEAGEFVATRNVECILATTCFPANPRYCTFTFGTRRSST
jgi:arginyl-tRNA synthetase